MQSTTELLATTATGAGDSTTTSTAAATSTTTTTIPDPGYPEPVAGSIDRWVPVVRASYPHDSAAFTQGLVVIDDTLYESTGLYGRSTVREVDLTTGDVVAAQPLPAEWFGEGLALVNDRLIQLTWQENTAVVWDLTLDQVERFTFDGEGWGLCDDGSRLVMSDGSPVLQFRDRGTFERLGEIEVTLDGAPVDELNELECVGGLVFANVWRTTNIVVIDPARGEVTAVIDASSLDDWSADEPSAVLNGIAYDDNRGIFYLTGKLWPTLFEVAFRSA